MLLRVTAHEEILQAIDKVMVKSEIYLNEKYATIFYELFKRRQGNRT